MIINNLLSQLIQTPIPIIKATNLFVLKIQG